jgi:hypothetical protein
MASISCHFFEVIGRYREKTDHSAKSICSIYTIPCVYEFELREKTISQIPPKYSPT